MEHIKVNPVEQGNLGWTPVNDDEVYDAEQAIDPIDPLGVYDARGARRVPLDIYMNKMINGVPFLARTRDISCEGLYVHRLLEPQAPEGARINLEFLLPGADDVVWTQAERVHGDDSRGIGFRFVALNPRDQALIRTFVESSSVC